MINTHQQQQQTFVWRNGVVSLHCSNVSNYINTYYEHFSSCYSICWIIIYTNCIGHRHLPRRKISLLAPGFMRISQLPTMERLRFVCKNASHTHTHTTCANVERAAQWPGDVSLDIDVATSCLKWMTSTTTPFMCDQSSPVDHLQRLIRFRFPIEWLINKSYELLSLNITDTKLKHLLIGAFDAERIWFAYTHTHSHTNTTRATMGLTHVLNHSVWMRIEASVSGW